MTRRRLASLPQDARGATIIEFAIIVPVMLTLIMGLSELAYQGYMQSVLAGTMQKAGRDSTIQGNEGASAGTAIDLKVKQAIYPLSRNATFKSTRKSYAQYGDMAPEPFQDNNSNGVYDAASECFTDLNGNKTWDADPGTTGQGGASDVVSYTMEVTYPRLFPLARLVGWPQTAKIATTTVLKNQPYKTQNAYSPVLKCP